MNPTPDPVIEAVMDYCGYGDLPKGFVHDPPSSTGCTVIRHYDSGRRFVISPVELVSDNKPK